MNQKGSANHSLQTNPAAACYDKQSVIGTKPHPFMCELFMAIFMLQCQSSVVVTETTYPQSLNYVLYFPLQIVC